MSWYMAMPAPQLSPYSASQPSTRMSAAAAASQPESSASAMAAPQGFCMAPIPVLPQWHQAAIMNQFSQDAAKKRRQELMQDRTNKRQNCGIHAASQPAAATATRCNKNPGVKGTVKKCGACGQLKTGHPKGMCPLTAWDASRRSRMAARMTDHARHARKEQHEICRAA